jgi:hypothetical protein
VLVVHVRVSEGAELVKDAAEGPHIAFLLMMRHGRGGHAVVGSALAELWGEVVRRAHHRLSARARVEQLGNAKVADLDDVVSVEEDVEGFEVAVEDLLRVDVSAR